MVDLFNFYNGRSSKLKNNYRKGKRRIKKMIERIFICQQSHKKKTSLQLA
jgi:hypothetical protein